MKLTILLHSFEVVTSTNNLETFEIKLGLVTSVSGQGNCPKFNRNNDVTMKHEC